MTAHGTPSKLEPLVLGPAGGEPALSVELVGEGEVAVLTIESGGRQALLTPSAGSVLGGWLARWSKPSKVPALLGIDGIAEEGGVERRTVHNWRKRPDFPKPCPVRGGGPVWEAAAVRAWLRRERPTPGRPKV